MRDLDAVEPRWLTIARSHLGQAEIPGAQSNPWIARLWIGAQHVWRALGADDSSAPWCGQFLAAVMSEAGIVPPVHAYRARAWLDWGRILPVSSLGCVVVFSRAGGGHVALVVGRDTRGRLLCLGGNQGDRVSIAPFDMARVIGYRWPLIENLDLRSAALPIITDNGASSRQEV